ncbi:MAG: hypothetical protein ACRBN8_44290 [Nannocystales bacterium]
MTEDEAFALLGVPLDADERTIKRAYHKLLRVHKPERDPEGFRRLRYAYELVTAIVQSRAMVEAFHAEPAPPSESPEDLSLATVHAALDRGAFAEALKQVQQDGWRAAILEGSPRVARTTHRVGLALVLHDRAEYEVLVVQCPEVFDRNDPTFPYLLSISPEWQEHLANDEPPEAVRAFMTQSLISLDPRHRAALGRDLSRWFERDPIVAQAYLSSLWNRYRNLGPFLLELVRKLDPELMPAPPPGPGVLEPGQVLRRLWWWLVAGAVVGPLSVYLLFAKHGWPRVLLIVAVACFAWSKEGRPLLLVRVHRRFLKACLAHDIVPQTCAAQFRRRPVLRAWIEGHGGLQLAFHVGRLARLTETA